MASSGKSMIIAYFMVAVTMSSMMSVSIGGRHLLQTNMPSISNLPKPTGIPPLPSIPTVTLPQPNINNIPALPTDINAVFPPLPIPSSIPIILNVPQPLPPLLNMPTNIPSLAKPNAVLPPLPDIPKAPQATVPPLPSNISSIPTIPNTIPSIPFFSPPPSN